MDGLHYRAARLLSLHYGGPSALSCSLFTGVLGRSILRSSYVGDDRSGQEIEKPEGDTILRANGNLVSPLAVGGLC